MSIESARGVYSMEFISAREAADKWGISQGSVLVLCTENRIRNASKVGDAWFIPAAAQKPVDAKPIAAQDMTAKRHDLS